MRERREWRERSKREEKGERRRRRGREREKKIFDCARKWLFNFKPTLGSFIHWVPGKNSSFTLTVAFSSTGTGCHWTKGPLAVASIRLRKQINPLEHGQGYFPKTARITSTRPCECVCVSWVSEISNVWLHVSKFIIVRVCENVITVTVLCLGLWISLCSCVWLFNVREWVFMCWIALQTIW